MICRYNNITQLKIFLQKVLDIFIVKLKVEVKNPNCNWILKRQSYANQVGHFNSNKEKHNANILYKIGQRVRKRRYIEDLEDLIKPDPNKVGVMISKQKAFMEVDYGTEKVTLVVMGEGSKRKERQW